MARQRFGLADGRSDAGLAVGLESRGPLGREACRLVQPIVRDIGLEGGFQRRHPQQPEIGEATDLLAQAPIGRIVALVVADHERDARAPGGLDHRPTLGHGKAHGLFDQHMLAGRRGDGDRRMTAGGQDQDRVPPGDPPSERKCGARRSRRRKRGSDPPTGRKARRSRTGRQARADSGGASPGQSARIRRPRSEAFPASTHPLADILCGTFQQ